MLPRKKSGGTESNVWYLDNGASIHMTGCKRKFTKLDEGVMGRVKFGDGSIIDIEGQGSTAFKCKDGEEYILNEVYYIPSLYSNTISIGMKIKL